MCHNASSVIYLVIANLLYMTLIAALVVKYIWCLDDVDCVSRRALNKFHSNISELCGSGLLC